MENQQKKLLFSLCLFYNWQMMPTPLYTMETIKETFEPKDFHRGRTYWREGAVSQLAVSADGRDITALVRGTHPKPYKVHIKVETVVMPRSGTSRVVLHTACSCPVSLDCKHAAAVCHAALIAPSNVQSDAVPNKMLQLVETLPQHLQKTMVLPQPTSPLDKWLNDLDGQAQQSDDPSLAPAKKPIKNKEQVIYSLSIGRDSWPGAKDHLKLEVFVASMLKDGSFSSRTRTISFDHLSTTTAKYIDPTDPFIGNLLKAAGNSFAAALQSPPALPEAVNLLIPKIVETGRCFFRTNKDAPFANPLQLGQPLAASLGWKMEPNGAQLPAMVLPEEAAATCMILPATQPWYVDTASHQIGMVELAAGEGLARKFLAGPPVLPDAVEGVARRIREAKLEDKIAVPVMLEVKTLNNYRPTPRLRLEARKLEAEEEEFLKYRHDNNSVVSGHVVLAHLDFDYAGHIIRQKDSREVLRQQEGNQVTLIPRNTKIEAHFNAALDKALAVPTTPSWDDDPRFLWMEFLAEEVPKLAKAGWHVAKDDAFDSLFTLLTADEADGAWEAGLKQQEAGEWWFALDLGIMVEGQRVALLPLLVQALKKLREPTSEAIEKMARNGKLYVTLEDGRNLALPFERVKDILLTLVELYDQPLNPDGTLNVPIDLATALTRIESATKMRWLGGEKLLRLIERLKTFSGLVEILPPRGLKATLRPYQREGLNWLQFLRDYGLGGILADDMGLGKTIQTLAHILTEKEAGRMDAPCLIICPTSLVPNWQDEAAKFAPGLKVVALHGKDRASRFGEIAGADLVLTTYPLLPRDADTLLPINWHLLVLDEAQAIKNPATKATQLVCEMQARHRLCLTGTPIENHLGEAWSHFAFLMPGMLGSHKDFNKRFRLPIEKHKDAGRQGVLARRLKPFILRRNKAEVAKELPPKTEIIHHVEFESGQRDLYETVRLTMHQKVQEAVQAKGFNRSRIIILDALLKLRQICCDPRLIKLTGAKKVKGSAKLESLMEMLPDMIEEGRRVLLFSQFTSMLDLIKPELDKTNIPFVEIRGDTTDRKTPVTQFQSGKVPLFLISLKAGGTGLNLTAADTVIHFDPWWNPAVENQATDRAHRLGQDKPVFVYKFIAKGTVEERIQELQNRKRHLATALLEERPDATAAFEADDLNFLFQEAA